MAPHVRRIRADELMALREIRLTALGDAPDAFSSTLAEESGQPVAFWAERAERGAAGDDTALFVAVDRHQWVGVVGGRRHAHEPRVDMFSMWVAPGHRGRGVATLLIAAVVEWAGDDCPVELWVRRDNAAAVAAYRSYGFAQVAPPADAHARRDPCADEQRMRLPARTHSAGRPID